MSSYDGTEQPLIVDLFKTLGERLVLRCMHTPPRACPSVAAVELALDPNSIGGIAIPIKEAIIY